MSNPIRPFLSDLTYEQIPSPAIYHAKRCLYDLIGTAVAGSQSRPAGMIQRHAEDHFSAGPRAHAVPALLGGNALSVSGAALVGGTVIDSIDAHDGQLLVKGHVGCSLLPSLVAVLETLDRPVSGTEFLTLLVAGYEIGTRCGIALHATVADYHTSGAWGAVNCAALAAHLLKLTDQQFEHALGIAEYHGPRSQMMRNVDYPTMLKDGSGWGAMVGISSAYQAAQGFTGAPAITVTHSSVATYWQDLMRRWYMAEQYIKPYPVCRWAQPAIKAALSISQQPGFNANQIDYLEVHTFHEGVRLFSGVPKDSEEAQYAISFPVAAAVLTGGVSATNVFHGFNDPDLQVLTKRVRLIEHTAYNEVFPAERWAHVRIVMRDGKVYKSGPSQSLGDPHQPLSDEQMISKYRQLCGTVWDARKTQAALNCVLNMEQHTLDDLLGVLRA